MKSGSYKVTAPMAVGAGSAIYLNNHMKLSKDPDVAAYQRQMKEATTPDQLASVFASRAEFIDYHKSRQPPPEPVLGGSVLVKVEGVADFTDVGTIVRVVNKDNPDEWIELSADFDNSGDLEFRITQGLSVTALRVRIEF